MSTSNSKSALFGGSPSRAPFICGMASLATQSVRRFGSIPMPSALRSPLPDAMKSVIFPSGPMRTTLPLRTLATKKAFVTGS